MTYPRSIITTFSILFILLWANPVNEVLFALVEKGDVGTGENYALVIGIGNYNKWPKLKSPSKDAEEIARVLSKKYDFKKENVALLTDNTKEKPTRVTILTYLDKYVSELTVKDNLLVFFSGHSTEDEKGETYWIPKDAKKKMKLTWLKHTDLCREFFASENFKAKNVCIVTDSLFSNKLIKPSSVTLSPYDLRYPEKIKEMASRRSRAVISFGDQHWPGNKNTKGFGLFCYYFRKALLENWLKVIDLENLIFDEKIIFPISKIAGTRLLCGRLRNAPMDKGGLSVITRVISPPIINVVDTNVSPERGFIGENFIIEAKTSGPAYEVYVEFDGQRHLMDGSGTEWKDTLQIASLGITRFRVKAKNQDDIEGRPKEGQIKTIKIPEKLVNVKDALVSPKRGLGGEEYQFTATTDRPASKVALIIAGNRFEMSGSDTQWSLKKNIEKIGTVAFSVVATNKEGAEGRSNGGILVVKAPLVNVAEVKATSDTGYAGEKFLITAKTDRPASAVSLQMDGVTYPMKGSGKIWSFKKKIPDIGKKQFTVLAKNIEGDGGLSKTGEILTKKRPLEIPDVAVVAVSPKKLHAGETLMIRVKTSAPADKVYVEMEGKKRVMEGAGTEWKYLTQIASVGTRRYKVIAKNKEGEQGLAKEGEITTTKKPIKAVDVIMAEVHPKRGYSGQEYIFKATTNTAAQGVTAVIEGKPYEMVGSGTKWSLKKKLEDLGTIDFYMIAKTQEGVQGGSKGGALIIRAPLVNVAEVKAAPGTGYAGEKFLITAKTDRPASAVSLQMDGVTYPMKGSGKIWSFKKKIPDIGKKQFTVLAKNIEGDGGLSKTGEILTRLPIPNVAALDVSVVSPGKGHAGDNFVFKVTTSTPADEVYVEIEGKKYVMEGTGTEWKYLTQIASVGISRYRAIAKNKEGEQGLAKEGEITTTKRPAELVNVAKAEVNPIKGYAGGKFTFKANTDMPAKGVTLIIGKNRYEMTGSGSQWSLKKKIEKAGTLVFSMIARNEDEAEGGAKTATFTAEEIKKRFKYNDDGTISDIVTGEVKNRFVDNGDGTVTDLSTNLTWLKQPKQIAITWEKAVEYCQKLEHKGYTGWRLPTFEEWKNFIDKKQQNPALPPGNPFTNVLTHTGYWSKTKHKFGPLYVYQMNLWNGKSGHQSKKKHAVVWPVRYSELPK